MCNTYMYAALGMEVVVKSASNSILSHLFFLPSGESTPIFPKFYCSSKSSRVGKGRAVCWPRVRVLCGRWHSLR